MQAITLNSRTIQYLNAIHKKATIPPKQVKQFSFANFLRYSYAFNLIHGESLADTFTRHETFLDTQERNILVRDSSGSSLIATAGSYGIHAKFLGTFITERVKELIEEIEFPTTFDSINFTLELKDGPQATLDDSYFFATLIYSDNQQLDT